MTANRSLFKTLAIAFVLVLIGVACTETASDRIPGINEDKAELAAAPAPPQGAEPAEEAHAEDEAEEAHAEDEAHEAEEAHAEDEAHEAEEAHSDDEDTTTEAEGRVVEVTMSEFAFDPGAIEVASGETVTFVVTNAGVVEHEFRLSNEHRIAEHLASGHSGHGEEGDGSHHGDADMVLLLPAGGTGQMTVTFPDDTTVFTHTACLIPGHYEAGMGGSIGYTA